MYALRRPRSQYSNYLICPVALIHLLAVPKRKSVQRHDFMSFPIFMYASSNSLIVITTGYTTFTLKMSFTVTLINSDQFHSYLKLVNFLQNLSSNQVTICWLNCRLRSIKIGAWMCQSKLVNMCSPEVLHHTLSTCMKEHLNTFVNEAWDIRYFLGKVENIWLRMYGGRGNTMG